MLPGSSSRGAGLNGEDTLLLQSELILKTAGVDRRTDRFARIQQADLRALFVRKGHGNFAGKAARPRGEQRNERLAPAGALQSQVRLMVRRVRFSLDYDPFPTLQKTMCPGLGPQW